MPDVIIIHETPTAISTASFAVPGATRLDIAGRFAWIPSPDNNTVSVYDVGNPGLMEIFQGVDMPGTKPLDVKISGRFAYITTFDKLVIADISNINFIPIVGQTAALGTELRDVFIVGKYALVLVQLPTPRLAVINIEDPTNPVEVNSLTLNNTPARAHYNFGSLFTVDKEGGAHIINVNDPLKPSLMAHLDADTDYPELVGTGEDVYVSGRWMYTLYSSPNKMVLLDLSDTLTPAAEPPFVLVNATAAKTIEVHADSVYLSNGDVIDVSDPFNIPPVLVTGPSADMITMIGKTGFALDNGNLKSISYSGIQSPTANIGSLKVSKITIFDDIDACNNARIHNKLEVGQGGIHCVGEVKTPNLQDISEKDQPNGYAGLDVNGLILASEIPIVIQSEFGLKEDKANKGQPNGYAGLDASQKLINDIANASQIPDIAQSQVTSLVTALAGKQPLLGFTPENLANKGAPNGYAPLDASGNLDLGGKSIKNTGGDSIDMEIQELRLTVPNKTQRFVMFRNEIILNPTNIGNFRARSLNSNNTEVNFVQFIFTLEDSTVGNENGSASLRAEFNGNSADFISYNVGKSGNVKIHRPLDLSLNKIINLAPPVFGNHAVNKTFADTTYAPIGANTVYVKTMADFPTPVSGVITLGLNTTYILLDSLATFDRFDVQNLSSNFITSISASISLTALGEDPLFSSASGATDGLLTLDKVDLQSSGLATLFNLKNQSLDFFRGGIFGFADVGTVRDTFFTSVKFSLALFNQQGLKIVDSGVTDVFKNIFGNASDTGQPFITIIGNNPATSISGNLFNRFPNETAVYFDPNLVSSGGGTVIADNGGTPGAGFFKIGTSASITAFGNSTVEPGVKTKVTSVAHGLINGEAVVITGAPNNNGTSLISNVTTDTFDIEKIFSVDDATGTWDTSSLDETDVLIRVRDVAFQKPSFSIAEARHDTDTTTVVDSIGEIVVLGGTNWTQGVNTEEWTVGTDGLMIYIGLEPKKFKFDGRNIVSKVGGGSDEIQTGFRINGTDDLMSFVPVDNNGPALSAPAEIRTFSTGNTVQVIGRNQSSTKDIKLHSGSKVLVTTV